MEEYMWIINTTIEAWKAMETFNVLPGTIFVSSPGGPGGAFLRYADGELTINNEHVDVGDYLPQFLGIIDAVRDASSVWSHPGHKDDGFIVIRPEN